ncbi:MAG: polysaccharide biosynthesis tyrosine autokinase [Phycisphaeraceae bacterium]|nr:polysaccharide biosynthesis tyrosine autokinase [Phycisphaeraceae bacterium]
MLFDHLNDKLNVPTDKAAEGVLDNRVLFLKKNLNVSVGKKDDIMAISFDSPYPKEAAQIVNAVVKAYIEYQAGQKRNTASEVLKILNAEKARRDEELTKNHDALLEFTKLYGVVSRETSSQHVVFKRLDRLSSELTESQLETGKTKSHHDVVASMSDDPDRVRRFSMEQAGNGVRVFVTDVETQLRAEQRTLEMELKSIREHCTEDHPATQALLGKIEKNVLQLKEEAEKFAETYLDVTRLKWVAAKQRQEESRVFYEAQLVAARELSVQAAEYYKLESKLRRTEQACDILDNRIKEINVTEDVGALNINILESARPAISPSKPQKARVMAMALVLGLMLGGGLALLRDMMDSRLRSADDIAAALDLPVVGVVPMMSAKLSISERGQKVSNEPMSFISEAFRTIRTALFFGVTKEKGQVFLITSPTPGDGKSSVVSNLAIAMAQSGQKTLIIDGDLRKPMQHKIFEIEAKQGLCTMLAGQMTLSEAIQPGAIENLDILPSPCGPDVPNPSEMLNGTAFSYTVSTLREQYDRIIIDSPPVTSVTDSHILSAMSDTTLMVVKAEKATRRLSQQARDTLLSVGANLFGVIVNAVTKKQSRYGYYSYRYYGSGQGKNGNSSNDISGP